MARDSFGILQHNAKGSATFFGGALRHKWWNLAPKSRFRAFFKRVETVRVIKRVNIKNLEPRFDSIETEKGSRAGLT